MKIFHGKKQKSFLQLMSTFFAVQVLALCKKQDRYKCYNENICYCETCQIENGKNMTLYAARALIEAKVCRPISQFFDQYYGKTCLNILLFCDTVVCIVVVVLLRQRLVVAELVDVALLLLVYFAVVVV